MTTGVLTRPAAADLQRARLPRSLLVPVLVVLAAVSVAMTNAFYGIYRQEASYQHSHHRSHLWMPLRAMADAGAVLAAVATAVCLYVVVREVAAARRARPV